MTGVPATSAEHPNKCPIESDVKRCKHEFANLTENRYVEKVLITAAFGGLLGLIQYMISKKQDGLKK